MAENLAPGWLRFTGLPGEIVPLDDRGQPQPQTSEDARKYLTGLGWAEDRIALALGEKELEPVDMKNATKPVKGFKVPKRR